MNRQQIHELAAFYLEQLMSWVLTAQMTNDDITRFAAREYIAFYAWILECVN